MSETPNHRSPICVEGISLPYLPLDQQVPSHVLGRRRQAISGETRCPYVSRPRLKRRGAISYDKNDSIAEYIRYLGDAFNQRRCITDSTREQVLELPLSNYNVCISRRTSRRGSMQNSNPACFYKESLKGSIIHKVDVEAQTRTTIQNDLRNVDKWDFDIFAFRRITEGRPLFHLGLHLLQKHNLVKCLKLDIMNVMKFLVLVEQAYRPDNLYHNCTHAADVTQALHCLLSENVLYCSIAPLEMLASILAAICHDLDHPGVSQSFLVNTSSYLASIHGSHSLLERHHCHEARAILKESQLLAHLSQRERQDVISLMEDLILATDVNRNKDFMVQFEDMLTSPQGINLQNKAERQFVLMIAIKAADISNPARCLSLSKCWSEKIMEEFFRQGDNERSMNLPVSYLCDRTTTTVPKSQSGFFEFVALPLFKAWSKLVGSEFSIHLCKNIWNNKCYWDAQVSCSSSDSEEN